jgi:hypothetical protein
MQFLAQKLVTKMEHPLYSPHLALYDFRLFLKIKSALKGQRFQNTVDIKKDGQREDNSIESYSTT